MGDGNMRNKKLSKVLIIIWVAIFILPVGLLMYSVIGEQLEGDGPQISQEIQDQIQQQDPANFDRNLSNYKALLTKLNVHIKFKNEIERLITDGHKLPDILTAYDFLNDSFGKMQEIEALVLEKESGKGWASVFLGYNAGHPEFVPGSFQPEYLEKLTQTEGITSDDIMLADRVSQKISRPASEVIDMRLSGSNWKDINAGFDIVNGQDVFPHVPVNREQIDKYIKTGLSEEQVLDAFVTANKFEKNVEDIIAKIKTGASREQIYAGCYSQKYY